MPARADAGRVIAGSARGVRLLAPGDGTRPLSDRVKQSLFAALEAEDVVGPGRAFLDLFAGSGAAGIEALSRASDRATFVEHDADAVAVIRENLRRAGFDASRAEVVRRDTGRHLSGEPAGRFDAILLDPPYASTLVEPSMAALGGWLAPGAVVVAKHFWRDAPPPRVGALERYRERRFGETMLSFYRRAEGEGMTT